MEGWAGEDGKVMGLDMQGFLPEALDVSFLKKIDGLGLGDLDFRVRAELLVCFGTPTAPPNMIGPLGPLNPKQNTAGTSQTLVTTEP